MQGVHFDGGQVTIRDDLPAPAPAADETRVAVLRAGVCATDLALSRGYMDFRGVPGHEFVGRALDGPLAGRRVVGEINAGCGECPRCRSGDPRHCPARTVLGILGRAGAFAEQLSLPTGNLHAVPDDVSTDAAVFVEPLAAANQITEQLDVNGARALVAGDGRLGLLCAWTLSLAGARVTLAGHHPERRDMLPNGAELVTEMLDGPGDGRAHGTPPAFDLAVEATGHPDVLARLAPHVVPGGTIVLKTTSELPVSVDLAPFVVNEHRLQGSRCGRFGPALRLLAEGRVPVQALIHARRDLGDALDALAAAGTRGVLKVLLDIGH